MLRFVRSVRDFTSSARRRRPGEGFLLDPGRLELAASAERMRVDRNGSVVSMLFLAPAPSKRSPRDIMALERIMASRLRLTDTAGWLRDGRLAVLLPDTPAEGAWKVASDLRGIYESSDDRPKCEVMVYPDATPGPPESRPGIDHSDSQDCHKPSGARPVGAGLSGSVGVSAFEGILVKPIPAWKRTIDILGASVGLAISAPVIAAAAAAIRLTSDGPAFFTQEREGLGGRRFIIRKLRTMRADAEQIKPSLRHHSEQDGPAFKLTNDPRVTRLGRLLRKSSLDELPQLLNVLTGDMSLVGPRPLPIEESLACKPWQRQRLQVTPGLTCIWQIHGRNVVPFDEWVRMDLEYAERRSPWLDLKLVAQTGPVLLLQKGR